MIDELSGGPAAGWLCLRHLQAGRNFAAQYAGFESLMPACQ